MRVTIEFQNGTRHIIEGVGSYSVDADGKAIVDSWLDVDELTGEPTCPVDLDQPIPFALTEYPVELTADDECPATQPSSKGA